MSGAKVVAAADNEDDDASAGIYSISVYLLHCLVRMAMAYLFCFGRRTCPPRLLHDPNQCS